MGRGESLQWGYKISKREWVSGEMPLKMVVCDAGFGDIPATISSNYYFYVRDTEVRQSNSLQGAPLLAIGKLYNLYGEKSLR